VRLAQLLDALVEREDAADAEQDDRNTWLPESASEWTPSASIDDDPEKAQAMNFVTAMPRFALSAAMIALLPP
jgi:hypothetical protein